MKQGQRAKDGGSEIQGSVISEDSGNLSVSWGLRKLGPKMTPVTWLVDTDIGSLLE